MLPAHLDREMALRHLEVIGFAPPDFVGLELRLLKAGGIPHIIRPNPEMPFWDELEKAQGEGFNVYYGVCARGEGPGGGKDNVIQTNVLWVDVDAKAFDPVDVSRGTVLALDHIKTTLTPDLGPTYYIASGHGWHLYWLLQNPFSFDLEGSGTYYESLLRRIAVPLRGDPKVADTARVMRLPGSLNLKNPANPVPCEVIESHPDRKFTIDVFDKAFPEQRDSSSGWQHKAAQTGGKASPSKKTLEFLAFGADEGSRNNRCFEAAADLAGCGFSEEETLEKILDAASRCGLPKAEAQSAVRSAYSKNRTPSSGFSTSPPPGDAAEADLDAALNELPLTDAGQAEAIVLLCKEQLRYVNERKKWIRWTGVHWTEDNDGEAVRLAIKVARRRQRAAVNSHHPNREKIIKWSLAGESRFRIEAALNLASKMHPFATSTNDYDNDPWLLGCLNGVLELRTGVLRPGKQDDLITMSTGVPYDPDAKAPRFHQFLREISAGNEELAEYIQRAIGYALTGQTTEQIIFICFGSGANGKTTFFNSLHNVFGDYAKNTPATTLLADPRGNRSQSNDLAALRGVRLVTASEVSEGNRLDEARVKAISGNDLITARFLFCEYTTYSPVLKVFLSVNHRPTIKGTDEAIWRRINLLPFIAHFPDGKADKSLSEKLAQEGPGILLWAVKGCLKWQEQGLGCPTSVRDATGSYRKDMDLLGGFLEECTVTVPGVKVKSSELYFKFTEWCDKNGLQRMNNIKFGKLLVERGIEREKHGNIYYMGIGLVSDSWGGSEDPDDFPSFFAHK